MNRAAAYLTTMFMLVGDRFENRKERGATAVEYGLMVGLIAAVIIATVVVLGSQLDALFVKVKDALVAPSGKGTVS